MSKAPSKVWMSADESDKEFGELALGEKVFFDTVFDGSEDLVCYVREDKLAELKRKNDDLRAKNKVLTRKVNHQMVVNAALHQMFEIKYEEATAFLSSSANPFSENS